MRKEFGKLEESPVPVSHSPLVSVVLSSHNHAAGLEYALDSIVNQEESNVECVVVDDDSTDGSLEIIRRYQGRLAYWSSEPCSENVDALNRAFARTTGDVMMWLNADEALCPWACRLVARVFEECADVNWLTSATPMVWSPSHFLLADGVTDGFSRATFFQGRNLRSSAYFHHPIRREATFWRRALWESSGAQVRANLCAAGDFELWTRFWEFAPLASLHLPLGGRQSIARTLRASGSTAYWSAAARILRTHGGQRPPSRIARGVRRILAKRELSFASSSDSRALSVRITNTGTCRMIWRELQ